MALQVWLPLNGDLHNQGLSGLTATNNGATINNNGKIGKCYQFGTASSYMTLPKEAMTSFTTEASVCFWLNILSWNTSYATYFQAGLGSSPWTNYIFGLLRNSTNSTCCFSISNGSTSSQNSYLTPALSLNTWYHIALIYKTGHCLIYINGQLYQDYTTSIVPNFSGITKITIGTSNATGSYQTNCLINDVRIYDHALSAKEVEEIAKGLVLHYKLDDRFYEPTTNLVTGLSSGGQTTVSNNIVTTSGTNADTYFTVNLSENIVNGTQYTIQCYAEMPIGTTWTFPIGSQSNSSLSWILKPGYNEYTFTANDISWGTKRIFLDDLSGSARSSGVQCKFYNFQLEKKDHATGFAGYGAQRGAQYDKNIYLEPDGTQWLHIAHHNNPNSSGYFTQSATWSTGVYINADKWYDVERVIPQVNKYEFMVKQKTTSSATEAKYRWIQNANPLIATYNDIKPGTITINTSSGYTDGSFGGIYLMNSSSRVCIANNNSANWYGAFGCWTTWSNNVPGVPNTTISTGYMDLYIRIDNTNLGIIYDSSGYSHNGAIVGNLTAAAGSPRYESATTFPTASDYFYFPHLVDSTAMNNEFTFSCWLYRDYTDATSRNFYYGLCQIYLYTDFKPRIGWKHASSDLSYDSGNTWAPGGGGTTIPLQEWTHLVFTFNNGVLYLYINGVQYGPSNRSDTGQFIHGTQGSPNASVGYSWIGKISDIRTYATALTAAQVKELYNTSMSVDASGNMYARELSEIL